MTALNFIIGFLGGGLVASLVNWIQVARSERANRAAAYLAEQLRLVYGPLYYFASQNKSYMELHRVISKAYKDEYEDKDWSDKFNTQETIRKETKQTIELMNKYAALSAENNDRMVEVLQSNYSLIDPRDADLFQGFVTHRVRAKIESGPYAPTFRVQKHLGNVTSYRSDFVDIIERRYSEKMNQARRLRQGWFPQWRLQKGETCDSVKWEIVTPRA